MDDDLGWFRGTLISGNLHMHIHWTILCINWFLLAIKFPPVSVLSMGFKWGLADISNLPSGFIVAMENPSIERFSHENLKPPSIGDFPWPRWIAVGESPAVFFSQERPVYPKKLQYVPTNSLLCSRKNRNVVLHYVGFGYCMLLTEFFFCYLFVAFGCYIQQ